MNPVTDKTPSLLDEIHLTRQRLLNEHGGIAGLAAFLRQREIASGAKTVSPPSTDKPLQTRSRKQ